MGAARGLPVDRVDGVDAGLDGPERARVADLDANALDALAPEPSAE